MNQFCLFICISFFAFKCLAQEQILLEAENFQNHGGWKVDQQFNHLMGSSYLLAHGMGVPVENASTTNKLPKEGDYRVWVRTKDWVPEHEAHPGTFQVSLNGNRLETIFGTNEGWNWVDGGTHHLSGENLTVELIDLTGFEGRCDAIYLTTDLNYTPSNNIEELKPWRRELLGLSAEPINAGTFDVVIVGGGMAGCCAAIAAAREGCNVALIHDRPLLGGNASEEVRVHTIGMVGYRIVDEVNTAVWSGGNGSDQAKEDQIRRNSVMENEPNVNLFLSTRAFAVNKEGRTIKSIDAKDIVSGLEYRFSGNQFIDCTGDGWIGYWAGNRFMIGREARSVFNESIAPETEDMMMMGTSVLFNSVLAENESTFPEVPWAMDVAKDYSETKNEWYWEYGIGFDPFIDAEHIRDHLLRAIYGAFYNAKQKPENAKRKLNWVGYIQGKRESRRLVGVHILTESDVRNAVDFEDGVVIEKREIDLHLPKSNTYDFLTYASFTQISPYHVPFRSFIAADFDNLMMAGRCLSASHVGLGSPRVMNTVGQMGVATGVAAGICKRYNTQPRGVYEDHLIELKSLVTDNIILPDSKIIYDNADASTTITGNWTESTYNPLFYGSNYLHDGNEGKGEKSVTFHLNIQQSGQYLVYSRHTSGETRASNAPFDIQHQNETSRVLVNQKEDDGKWIELGTYYFESDGDNTITISNKDTDGHVIVDAIALVPQNNTSSINLKKEPIIGIDSINVTDNKVSFNLSALAGDTTFEIYSINGSKLVSLNLHLSSGHQSVVWNNVNRDSIKGVYIASFRLNGEMYSKKFVM